MTPWRSGRALGTTTTPPAVVVVSTREAFDPQVEGPAEDSAVEPEDADTWVAVDDGRPGLGLMGNGKG